MIFIWNYYALDLEEYELKDFVLDLVRRKVTLMDGYHYLIQLRHRTKLQRRFRFDDWHLIPLYYKKTYALDIIQYINDNTESFGNCAIEIGCGLGDIIGNLVCRDRVGYDLCPKVINAARIEHRDCDFVVGTFDAVTGKSIDWLIAVNFIHNIAPDELRNIFSGLIAQNQVRNIVVDSVSGAYAYTHNFNEIIPPEYTLLNKMGPSPSAGKGERWILIFSNMS